MAVCVQEMSVVLFSAHGLHSYFATARDSHKSGDAKETGYMTHIFYYSVCYAIGSLLTREIASDCERLFCAMYAQGVLM
jgi:hypothetical protein